MATDRVVVDVSALAGLVLPDEAAGNTGTALPGRQRVGWHAAGEELGERLHVDRGQTGGGGQGLQG